MTKLPTSRKIFCGMAKSRAQSNGKHLSYFRLGTGILCRKWWTKDFQIKYHVISSSEIKLY